MFYSENFSFDGIDNEEMDIALVTTTNTDILNQLGTIYIENIKAENTRTDSPYYLFGTKDIEPITLEFAYVDLKTQVPLVWDEEVLDEVIDWLVTDDFKPFISQDNEELIYYLKATKVFKKFNNEMKGMLEIEFQPYTAYAYKNYTYELNCEGSLEYDIKNESTIKDKYYAPVIEITKTIDPGDIKIENLSIPEDKALIVEHMAVGEKRIIDNYNYTIFDSEGKNMFFASNRQWLRLVRKNKNNKQGINKLKITGNCKITIKCNYPKII